MNMIVQDFFILVVRDSCHTAVDKYLPHQLFTEQLDILEQETTKYTAAVHQRSVGDGQPVFWVTNPGTTTPILDFRNLVVQQE
jgi:hypothetical protein